MYFISAKWHSNNIIAAFDEHVSTRNRIPISIDIRSKKEAVKQVRQPLFKCDFTSI